MPKEKSSLDRIIGKVGRGLDRAKKACEPVIDEVLLFSAFNAAATYQALEIADRSSLPDPANDLIMLGAGIAIAAADYFAFFSPKTKYARKLVGKMNKKIDKIRPASWMKTAILAGCLAYGASGISPYVEQLKDELSRPAKKTEQIVQKTPKQEIQVSSYAEQPAQTPAKGPSEQPAEMIAPAPEKPAEAYAEMEWAEMDARKMEIHNNLRTRPDIYDELGYEAKVNHDFTSIRLDYKDSMIGMIQRTLRWQPIYHTIEKAHGLRKNTLAGMIMLESMGDPVQPNMNNDGGLGLVHEQGLTAKNWGLKIFGASYSYSDPVHGKSIKRMLEECKYDPASVQKMDERAHPIKNLDTAARIIAEGMIKYDNSWEKGVEYFRAPGLVGRNLTWDYMKKVEKWMKVLENPNLLEKAAIDFGANNSCSFKDYLSKWHEMSNNWGLDSYVNDMPGIDYAVPSMAQNMPDVVVEQKAQPAMIAAQKPAPKQDPWITYTAKPGDTVFGITQRIAKGKISQEQFTKQNNIYQNKIVPNQRYKLYKTQ